MGFDRRAPRLHNISKQVAQNRYISQCKMCGLGIYEGQKYAWRTRPMGLSHDDCPEQP